MACEVVSLPGGNRAIVCGPRLRASRCACGAIATLLCDWKRPAGSARVTCDAPLCARCTTSPAPDKDLCPTHAAAFARRQAERTVQPDLFTETGDEPTKPAPSTDADAAATASGVLTAGAQP